MGYEVDFLGVGEESKSGDAIAIRFGNLYGDRSEQTVIIIDGGFKDTGEQLVAHIKNHFDTDTVDIVINTHPDQDHINGLETVFNELTVKELWVHQPWNHNQGIADQFEDGRVTDNSIGERLKDNLEKAWALVKLAESLEVTIKEPFTGQASKDGVVKVLGPSVDYYEELIPQFEGMPAVKSMDAQSEGFITKAFAAIKRIFASWGEDLIDDEGETSAKNNSSVVTQLIVDGRKLLFTGDAGIQALEHVATQMEQCVSGADLRFIQVPHHGSQRNIGPSVLNRIVGTPVAEGGSRSITAIASTAKSGEPKHPRKSVMNAFTHRGAKTLATRGKGIQHSHEAPDREGWGALSAEPYHYEFEEEV